MSEPMRSGDLAKSFGKRAFSDDDAPQSSGNRCAAHGCPMPGSLSTGGASRYCQWHFGAGVDSNDRITAWLRRNPLAVEALYATEAMSVQAMRNMGDKMAAAGLSPLVPQVRTLSHEGYGRHGEGIAVVRDEAEFPKLYMQRIRGWVATQIAASKA